MKAPWPLQSPQCPYPGHIGLQLVVHPDVAPFVALNACLVQAQIIGVGDPAHRQQQMGTGHFSGSLFTIQIHSHPVFILLGIDAVGI